ncbi:hypothetical protein FQN57_003769 [Myotisia sp. PD_48]|nr:hypothetical protein FQN57_003769 [Myotisia sp. PD_48]
MRSTQLKAVLALSFLAAIAVADDFDRDEVPTACRAICEPVVNVARTCDDRYGNHRGHQNDDNHDDDNDRNNDDNDNNDDDNGDDRRRKRNYRHRLSRRHDHDDDQDDQNEWNCICNAAEASLIVPMCQACIAANPNNEDDDDKDINEIMRRCAWQTTTYNPSVASSIASTATIAPVTTMPTNAASPTQTTATTSSTNSNTPAETSNVAASLSTMTKAGTLLSFLAVFGIIV